MGYLAPSEFLPLTAEGNLTVFLNLKSQLNLRKIL